MRDILVYFLLYMAYSVESDSNQDIIEVNKESKRVVEIIENEHKIHHHMAEKEHEDSIHHQIKLGEKSHHEHKILHNMDERQHQMDEKERSESTKA